MNKEIRVAYVINDSRLALNIGEADGVCIGGKYLIYGKSDRPIIDPVTREDLGFLEIPRGRGKVVNVQDNLCVVESYETQIVKRREKNKSPMAFVLGSATVVEYDDWEQVPFIDAKIGDCAKPI